MNARPVDNMLLGIADTVRRYSENMARMTPEQRAKHPDPMRPDSPLVLAARAVCGLHNLPPRTGIGAQLGFAQMMAEYDMGAITLSQLAERIDEWALSGNLP